MKLTLNAENIAGLTLSPGQHEAFIWDTELAGFGVRLQGKRRTYVAQYRADGRTRRITLGPVSRLTPDEARKAARKVLARATLGEDPQEEKAARRARAKRTFAKVVEAYIFATSHLRPMSIRLTKLYLAGPYFRSLHAIGIGEIKRADVAACLSAIARKHGSSTTIAARKKISALFAWAMREGWIDANPVSGTNQPPEAKSRDRVLSDAELVAVWNACDQDDDFSRIVRLLILTACRRQEVGGMRWSEFEDLATGIWTIPGERTKNHRAHTLSLPPAAIRIVRSQADMRFAARGEREYLFGVRSGRGYAAWDHAKADLDRRLNGTVKPFRLHDLRRTTATCMADIGIEPHVIEQVLNHQSGHKAGPAGVYNRSVYEQQAKAALFRWAEHVRDLVEGRAKRKVIALHV